MENEHINPWLQIWTHPRKTFRYILNKYPQKYVLILAIIGGILSAISLVFALRSTVPGAQPTLPKLGLLFAVIFGALGGIVHLYFGGWLYRLTGSWIGGKGTFNEVKSSVGWSNYPYIITSLISIIGYLTVQHPIAKGILGLLNLVVAIWGLIIFLNLLSEAHKFSNWKGLLTFLIAFALIFVIVLVIALIIPLLTPLFQ